MGGEHGAHGQPVHRLRDLGGRDAAVPDLLRGAIQPATLGRALPPQLARPVRLFGDVGQVEVGGEGAGQLGGRGEVHVGEASRGGDPVGAHQPPYLFDKVEQGLALLADQCLAEQYAEAADVGPKVGVQSDGLDEVAVRRHARSLLRCELAGRSTSGCFAGRRCPGRAMVSVIAARRRVRRHCGALILTHPAVNGVRLAKINR